MQLSTTRASSSSSSLQLPNIEMKKREQLETNLFENLFSLMNSKKIDPQHHHHSLKSQEVPYIRWDAFILLIWLQKPS